MSCGGQQFRENIASDAIIAETDGTLSSRQIFNDLSTSLPSIGHTMEDDLIVF